MQSRVLGRTQVLASSALAGTLAMIAPAASAQPVSVDEIIVTASRRSEDVTSIPYNISAIGGAEVAKAGISTIEDLARTVPNLNLNSAGARFIGSQRPVMRGLNASASARSGQALEQAPVATYLGNVPTGGDFPIDDIDHVEVLRGPQGTLYGAGALGGAVRIIPKSPQLGVFEGSITSSAGVVAHSEDLDYSLGGVVNAPLGETVALRLSAKHQRDAGFSDVYGAFKRQGNWVSPPVLANPADVANSGPVLETLEDVNWTKTNSARVSLRWQPTAALDIEAAYNLVEIRGEGGPNGNPSYAGGPDPLDPRIVYPDTGDYDLVQRARTPYKRGSHMASLDASYDLGFATVSTTASYYETRGQTVVDNTYVALSLPAGVLPYYIGDPVNPRFNYVSNFTDAEKLFTQEVRLVSAGDGPLSYVAGAYFQKSTRNDDWYIYIPGSSEQAAASGGMPIVTGPGGLDFTLFGQSEFTDLAVFGELKWQITDAWQVTGGARFFKQTFERDLEFELYVFGLGDRTSNEVSETDSIFKLNTSYEFRPNHQAYATFSQGFRRGGANAFALTGPLSEPESLLDYQSDTVDNYEAGVKGRFAGGLRYTFDVFYDAWTAPQVGIFTPANQWPVVANGDEARSQGVELEVGGPLGGGFNFLFGYAYSDATLTKDFCVPTGNGRGGVDPCGIPGVKGGRLPGAPKHSATLNLEYERELGDNDTISVSFNASYKGDLLTALPTPGSRDTRVPEIFLANAKVSWDHGPWSLSIYGKNIFDERGIYATGLRDVPFLNNLNRIDTITPPRSVGAQLRFNW